MSETNQKKCCVCGTDNQLVMIQNADPAICQPCYEKGRKEGQIEFTPKENGNSVIVKVKSLEEAKAINSILNVSLDKLSKENEELKTKLSEQPKPLVTGSVPLNKTSGGTSDSPKQGYETATEMYSDLKARELAGDQEAHVILNKLTEKFLVGIKEGTTSMNLKPWNTENVPLADMMNEIYRKQVKIQRGGK